MASQISKLSENGSLRAKTKKPTRSGGIPQISLWASRARSRATLADGESGPSDETEMKG